MITNDETSLSPVIPQITDERTDEPRLTDTGRERDAAMGIRARNRDGRILAPNRRQCRIDLGFFLRRDNPCDSVKISSELRWDGGRLRRPAIALT